MVDDSLARLMYYRVLGTARSVAAAVFGRRYSFLGLNRSLSDLAPTEMSYRGGYGRRGRGPNRCGGRGRGRGGSRGRGAGGGVTGAEGHGAPPPAGLRGRALGMWYASRSRAHKRAREKKEVSSVHTCTLCGKQNDHVFNILHIYLINIARDWP